MILFFLFRISCYGHGSNFISFDRNYFLYYGQIAVTIRYDRNNPFV